MTTPTVTLCGIVKDEGPYLLEWMAYHGAIGFQDFLIYDNESTDFGADILRDLSEAGYARVSRWPTLPRVSPQLSAYEDALTRVDTDFVAFLDVDEFLNLHRHETVGGWLSAFPPKTGAIGVNWRIFGTAGAERYEPGLVIQRFARCAPIGAGNNRHLKYVARPLLVKRPDIHYCELLAGLYLNADGDPLQMSRPSYSDTVTYATAQVNHYALKSREEFEWKKARGNAARPADDPRKFDTRSSPDYWAILDRNEEEDASILRHVAPTIDQIDRLSRGLRPETIAGLAAFADLRRAASSGGR